MQTDALCCRNIRNLALQRVCCEARVIKMQQELQRESLKLESFDSNGRLLNYSGAGDFASWRVGPRPESADTDLSTSPLRLSR